MAGLRRVKDMKSNIRTGRFQLKEGGEKMRIIVFY